MEDIDDGCLEIETVLPPKKEAPASPTPQPSGTASSSFVHEADIDFFLTGLDTDPIHGSPGTINNNV